MSETTKCSRNKKIEQEFYMTELINKGLNSDYELSGQLSDDN